MKKKILIITEFMLNHYNSVRDILYNIVFNDDLKEYEIIVAAHEGNKCSPFLPRYLEGIKSYYSPNISWSALIKSKDVSFSSKLCCIGNRIKKKLYQIFNKEHEFVIQSTINFLSKILDIEKPDLIISLSVIPCRVVFETIESYKTPIISLLCDTYIEHPFSNKEKAYRFEKNIIDVCRAYFIPNFFYSKYKEVYNNSKVKEYKLPLLINKQSVYNAYNGSIEKYEFSYFGQIQSFRNEEEIKNIFCSINKKIHVFSTEKHENDQVYCSHQALTGEELFKTIANTKFLVAFDNNPPFEHFLPSKAYLYTSFTKPIIVFGKNKKSALKTFLNDYPTCYYQEIGEPLDGLIAFINGSHFSKFDQVIYSQYEQYLPQNALTPLVKEIDKILAC